MSNEWTLAFVLPNLNIRNPVEWTNLALIPPDDPRLSKIKNDCLASKALLTKFSTQFGEAVKPCAIIFKGRPPSLDKVVDFRNSIAIPAIIKGTSLVIKRGQSLEVRFSDCFDLYPITPGNDKKSLLIHNPAQLGIDEPDKFSGQISPLLVYPIRNTAVPDEVLFGLLLRFWKSKPKRRSWKARAIFRSMQMAYQASSIIYSNPFSEFDIGSHIALWVSAFETITHPGDRSIELKNVLGLLGSYKFFKSPLKRKSYTYRKMKVNFIQKIYGQLYESRNAFLHGNPIKNTHLYPMGKIRGSFLIIAPLLYRIALIQQLANAGISRPDRNLVSVAVNSYDDMDFESTLLKYISL